jgi:hypothetical protein
LSDFTAAIGDVLGDVGPHLRNLSRHRPDASSLTRWGRALVCVRSVSFSFVFPQFSHGK